MTEQLATARKPSSRTRRIVQVVLVVTFALDTRETVVPPAERVHRRDRAQ